MAMGIAFAITHPCNGVADSVAIFFLIFEITGNNRRVKFQRTRFYHFVTAEKSIDGMNILVASAKLNRCRKILSCSIPPILGFYCRNLILKTE